MADLRISNTFALPVDFVTWTQAILAKKGSGKSYTASVEAEELLGAGQQIVVIDPTGAWWGLRSSADGAAIGHPIAVLGGEHGDVPIESTAGEVVADAIATEHFSAIVDLSLFRKGEAMRFMAAFLETLYRKNRQALHLFIDEADVVAPQKPYGEEARTLSATEDIVRRGRIRGIGCTLITQRPQVVSKNVLSQVDMLTALRMNHPKDLGAIDEWVAVHADDREAKKMLASLPALPIGDAWIWAPAENIFERVTIRRRRTFDSGRTPKAGERAIAPKVLAAVDIARLGKSIASTVERVKQDDPKALRARIVELERQLAASVEIETVTVDRIVEVPVAPVAELLRIQTSIGRAVNELATALVDIKALTEPTARPTPIATPVPVNGVHRADEPRHTDRVKQWPGPTQAPDGKLVPAQQRVVDTIATLDRLGIESTRTVLAAWLGTHPNSKGYVNNLGSLRSAGLVDGFALTADGKKQARPQAPRTRAEVREMLLRPLPAGQRRIVEIVLKHGQVGREDLAAELDKHPNSKGLVNDIGALRDRALLSQGWPLRAERVFQVGAA